MIYKDILRRWRDEDRSAGIHLLQADKKQVIFAKISAEVTGLYEARMSAEE
jgi:hypothetical protein